MVLRSCHANAQWVWSIFDPEATGFVGVHRIRQLVTRVALPLAFRNPRTRWMRLVRWVSPCSAAAHSAA